MKETPYLCGGEFFALLISTFKYIFMKANHVCGKIYHIGVNDRRKPLFENMWPLPGGVAYNSYLIADQKTALLDTVELGTGGSFADEIKQLLGGRELDYLVVNHMEPDHSGEIKNILEAFPHVTVVGNKFTLKILQNYWGTVQNFQEVKDGEDLPLGHHILRFVTTPMVHWPESMMTYDLTENVLFAQDAFGAFGTLDGTVFDDQIDLRDYETEMRRYYSNIVGKHSLHVQKALAKLNGVSVSCICPLHGVMWRKNPAHAVELYDKWSRYEAENAVLVLFASMYHNTEVVADYIAGKIVEEGVNNVRVYDVSKTHVSYLISEAWRCKSIVLGSCAYNGGMHPMMELFCREMEHYGLKNRQLALFGSYSWGGGGLRALQGFADGIGWEASAAPVELAGKPDNDKLKQFDQLAKDVVVKLN